MSVYNGSVTVSIPKELDGKYIHKVGMKIGTKDIELTKYKETDSEYEFIADITVNNDKTDYETYETYYIYNYVDGNYDTAMKTAANILSSDSDNGEDEKQLYKQTLGSGTINYEQIQGEV